MGRFTTGGVAVTSRVSQPIHKGQVKVKTKPTQVTFTQLAMQAAKARAERERKKGRPVVGGMAITVQEKAKLPYLQMPSKKAKGVKIDTGKDVSVYEVTTTKGTTTVAGTSTHAINEAMRKLGGTLVSGGLKKTGVVKVYGAETPKEAREAADKKVKAGTITKTGKVFIRGDKGEMVEGEGGIIKDAETGEYRACPSGVCPCNIQVKVYRVKTDKGEYDIEAADADQAKRLAEEYYNAKVYSVGRVIKEKTFTPQEAYEKIQNAASTNQTRAAEAMITYGTALGAGYGVPVDMIPVRDGKTRNMVFVPKSDWEALPDEYKEITQSKGFVKMQETFLDKHIQLGDGQWISREDWNKLAKADEVLGTNYTELGMDKGYEVMSLAIKEQNEAIEAFKAKVGSGELMEVAGGDYVSKEDFDSLPSGAQEILKKDGFGALERATTIWFERLGDYKYPKLPPGLQQRPRTGEFITNEEYKALPKKEQQDYILANESVKRAFTWTFAALAPPAKGLLPEYTIADVSAIDWAICAANVALIGVGLAPGAIASSAAGKAIVVGASGTLSGVIGYSTAKNWESLSPAGRSLGIGIAVLCAVPLLTTVARNVKVGSSPALPTKDGAVVAWKGLSVAGYPVIGRSGGKWILGTRALTLPEARLILNGYHPEMMLETKVFVNRAALQKAGVSRVQIDYLVNTLKTRNLLAGKTSLWLDKNVLLEPTQRLNASEIDIIMRRLTRLEQGFIKKRIVKDAHLLYGSATIKSQLAPELRGWRAIHDWDISLNLNQAKTEAFTRTLLKDLQAKGGGVYRISPKAPTLIEKKILGRWVHIADIHSLEVAPTSAMNLPQSRLDATGTYSYGKMVAEPAITIEYPGVGKLHIMRISEAGVRKADTILRVRQTPQGTVFRPPQRGIAQPGVPKDAADYYVIVRNLLGEEVAEDWLKSWAKAMGYTKSELVKVLPRIRTAMLEVASKTPSDIIGYKFVPAASPRVAVGASPTVIIHIPSSLGASVSASLARRISQPINPYKLSQSARIQSLASSGLYSLASRVPKKSPSIPRISPAPSMPVSKFIKSPSPAISAIPSPSPVPSAYPSAYLSPSGKPSPTLKPSPAISPYPSPYIGPYPSFMRKPTKPKRLILISVRGEKRYKIPEGSIAWKQGELKQGEEWKYIPPPWKQEKPITIFHPPLGARYIGEKTPEKTIQMIGKSKAKVPKSVSIDLGVVDIRISNYGREIAYTGKGLETVVGQSIAESTKGMSIPAIAPMKVGEGYAKLAFGTSLRVLVAETYKETKKKIPKKFADRILSNKLSKMSAKKIAKEIKESKIGTNRKDEILKMLPDRVRREVELWLGIEIEYAPTRGVPKAELLPPMFRHKKKKKVKEKTEIVQSASAF